jgi:hypothetical protein
MSKIRGNLKAAPGAELVDFDRGRVKPRTTFDVAVGLTVYKRDRISTAIQFMVQNVFDRGFAYNFGNPLRAHTLVHRGGGRYAGI